MRVLVLDDETYRLKEFLRVYSAATVVETRTAQGAIEALDDGPRFDIVTLDHDLGGEGTGRDVAEHVAAMPAEKRPRMAIVHSWNAPGAAAMVTMLKRAGVPARHQPFTCGAIIGDTESP